MEEHDKRSSQDSFGDGENSFKNQQEPSEPQFSFTDEELSAALEAFAKQDEQTESKDVEGQEIEDFSSLDDQSRAAFFIDEENPLEGLTQTYQDDNELEQLLGESAQCAMITFGRMLFPIEPMFKILTELDIHAEFLGFERRIMINILDLKQDTPEKAAAALAQLIGKKSFFTPFLCFLVNRAHYLKGMVYLPGEQPRECYALNILEHFPEILEDYCIGYDSLEHLHKACIARVDNQQVPPKQVEEVCEKFFTTVTGKQKFHWRRKSEKN